MSDRLNLSVVIPCRNAELTLDQQLDALCRQDWRGPWEVVVADNGSTDRSVGVALSYRHCLPSLKVIDASARGGVSYARNLGLSAAEANLIAFCDGDDVVGPAFVRGMAEGLREHPLVAARRVDLGLNEPTWAGAWDDLGQADELPRVFFPPYSRFVGGYGFGVRRQVHDLVGGFDETLLRGQDTEYCVRLHLLGIEPFLSDIATVDYRLPSTVRAAYLQARGWGEGSAHIYAAHCPPRERSRQGWLRSLRAVGFYALRHRPAASEGEAYVRWARNLGFRVGLLRGSAVERVRPPWPAAFTPLDELA